MMMNLEFLPNEILFNIFDYIDGVNLLRAFYGLNSHFDSLLNSQFQNYHFKFNFISKGDFDMVCQEHIPSIADRVITLGLSDFDETPGQIDLFLVYIPSFSQFTHLRSLTVGFIRSYDTLLTIIDKCHDLCNLTDLNFCFCYLRDDNVDSQLLINDIWNLPKLVHCNFGIDFQKQQIFCTPTIISSTIKSVNISSKYTLKLNEINRLFEYTPCLECLSICTEHSINENYKLSSFPPLIELNISGSYLSDFLQMIVLLQHMPNLCRLKINLTSYLVDGHQWERIIRTYLSKLKVFQLTMKRKLFCDRIVQKRVDELINSFRGSFWIDEHKWFVRCLTEEKTIYLYTLSNTTDYIEDILYDSWKSTYPLDDQQQQLYINKTNIYNEIFFEQPIPSVIRLTNIQTLWIKFPINNQFWSLVPSLSRLSTLRISFYVDTFQKQLQALLDRAPQLRYLTIHEDIALPFQISLFKNIYASVRRLNLINYNHYFSEDECLILVRSPLIIQCKILSILVKNCECIIQLVENMVNLQTLNARCEDENYFKQLASIENSNEKYSDENQDKIIQSLKDRLPTACLILRNPDSVNDISVWI